MESVPSAFGRTTRDICRDQRRDKKVLCGNFSWLVDRREVSVLMFNDTVSCGDYIASVTVKDGGTHGMVLAGVGSLVWCGMIRWMSSVEGGSLNVGVACVVDVLSQILKRISYLWCTELCEFWNSPKNVCHITTLSRFLVSGNVVWLITDY
jgi:hypothetical protein